MPIYHGTIQGQQTVGAETFGIVEVLTDTLTIAPDGSVAGTQSIDSGHAFDIANGMETDTPITPVVGPITGTVAGGLGGGNETFSNANTKLFVNLPNPSFIISGTLTALPPILTLSAPSSIVEGNSGNVQISLFGSSLSSGDVYEFQLQTANGTATSANYNAVNQTVTLNAANNWAATIPVQTLQDLEGITDVDPLFTDGTFTIDATQVAGLGGGPLIVDTSLADATITVLDPALNYPQAPNGATQTSAPPGATNWTTPTPPAGQTQYSNPGPNTKITIQVGPGNQWIATAPLNGGDSDTIIGGSGTDQFIAGSGNNFYEAGLGTVTVDYSNAPAGINANLATGVVGNGFGGTDHLTGIHVIAGSTHNDTVVGGQGCNTFVLPGNRASFTVTRSGLTTTVSGAASGTDTLTGIEALQFADGTMELPEARSDFTDVGTSGALWRNGSTGEVDTWLFNNGHLSGGGAIGSVSTAWQLLGTGDFNGDDASDILWRNTVTGEVDTWLMNNGHLSGGGAIGTVSSAWQFAAIGDFNDDCIDDVLWRNTVTGEVDTWLMTSGRVTGGTAIGTSSSAWQVLGAGDFNGDGTSDILWRNTVTGEVDTWLITNDHLSGGGAIGVASSAWQFLAAGDFNGDGTSDILWRNTVTGEVDTWLMNNGHLSGGGAIGTASSAWKFAASGDFNGNGTGDALWRNTATGEVDTWLLTNGHVTGGGAVGTVSSAWTVPALP
jgi:hypothetical protein